MRGRALLLAAVVAFASTGTTAARAASSSASGGWYWADQVTPPANTVQQPLPTPDVPASDYAVAAKNGDSDKETYLHVGEDAVPTPSTVSRVVVTLKEDGSGANVNDTNALIVAVPVTEFWVDGARGSPYDVKPEPGTTPAVAGKNSSGTWTFDITPIAKKWADGSLANNGVALIPKPGAGLSFEVVWGATVSVESDATASESSSDTGAFAPSSDTGSGGSAASAPGAAAPAAGTDTATATGSADVPTGAVTSPPTPASGNAAAPSTPARRVARRHAGKGIPLSFVAAALLVVALLIGAMVSLGEMGEPTGARKGSVLRRLERRPDATS